VAVAVAESKMLRHYGVKVPTAELQEEAVALQVSAQDLTRAVVVVVKDILRTHREEMAEVV
jgi:phosphoribosylformylglycinamidine (FGAM) synthase-like enzyme